MIINRYLKREVLGTLLAVTGVLYLIFVSNRFINLLSEASVGNIPDDVVFRVLALKSFSNLPLLLPLALFFSVIVAFGRLYRDNEMIAIAACGMKLRWLVSTVLGFALVFALLVGSISLFLGPWAEQASARIQDEAEATLKLKGMATGQFREISSGKAVFYLENYAADGRTMENIFVHSERNGTATLIVANRGDQKIDPDSGREYLELSDGYRYEGVPGTTDFRIVKFDQHGLLIKEQVIEPSVLKRAATSTTALWHARDNSPAIAELQWRISAPLMTLLLALLAVPLSRSKPREGRYSKLFIAIMVYVIYSNLLGVSRSWLQRGLIEPELGLWWVHIGMLLIIIVMLLRQGGIRWRLQQLKT